LLQNTLFFESSKMAAIILSLHPENPQERLLKQALQALQEGKVLLCPTDTLYGLVCAADSTKGVERICRIKGIDPKKHTLSLLCKDWSQAAAYIKTIPNPIFRLINKLSPGPYAFILPASHEAPKGMLNKRKTIGIRIPYHPVPQWLLENLSGPLITSSVARNEQEEFLSDTEDLIAAYENEVDMILEAGPSGMLPSTIIDMSSDTPELIRLGAGEWE
jgi:tRNA threonylcarbamoyl adenosine modification protein (Sua5/YciO/YrdC/YwlC family)